jgi:hypothetical protein
LTRGEKTGESTGTAAEIDYRTILWKVFKSAFSTSNMDPMDKQILSRRTGWIQHGG